MQLELANLLRRKEVVPAVVGAASFVAGLGVGYILGKRKKVASTEETPSTIYPNQLALDFEGTNTGDPLLNHTKINQLLAPYQTALEETFSIAHKDEDVHDGYTGPRGDPKDIVVTNQPNKPVPPLVNPFQPELSDWDYEAELSTRSSDAPYVIHEDEFFGEEMGFDTSTLTYYAGDDILTDESDVPIYNYPAIVGELRFGHGCKDPNTVYIRNEKLRAEYEIYRDPGSYEIEVLGQYVEKVAKASDLKHSKSIPKFRQE